MAGTQYNNDSNPFVGSPSAGTTVNDADPYTSLHGRHAQGAFNQIFCDSGSRGNETETFPSNIAQQDHNESPANGNDVSFQQSIDSPAKGAEHRNTILPDYKKNFFESESRSQPCCCTCHDWSFDQSQAAPQIEQELTPLERWDAERPSEGSTTSHWQHRSNLSPCRACSCHGTMGRSAYTTDDSLDEDEKSKERALSALGDRQIRG